MDHISNIKAKTIKLLEEKIRGYLCDLGVSVGLLEKAQKVLKFVKILLKRKEGREGRKGRKKKKEKSPIME